jgi:tetratricopeptide (TPR) repeat protein
MISVGKRHGGPILLVLGVAVAWSTACRPQAPSRAAVGGSEPAQVGCDPAPRVHLFENHSSALVAWRRAGVRDRIALHLDGHADFDWLPDGTIARIAAARPEELAELESHPYAMDGPLSSRFSSADFLYAAARLGIVRELVWVVPDGTLREGERAAGWMRQMLLGKVQMLTLAEVEGLKLVGHRMEGTLLGVPLTICELADLPELGEPVLLDIDLDYFTTRSALTQEVLPRPWISPDAVIERLSAHGVRTDLVTLSLSTIGGGVPPACRWLGVAMQEELRAPRRGSRPEDLARQEAAEAGARRAQRAIELYARLVKADPEDASSWYALSDLLRSVGRLEEAGRAMERAARLDRVLDLADLFEGDQRFRNGDDEGAVAWYDRYLERFSNGPFGAYALSRKAGCLARLNREGEALAALRQVVELAPRHAQTRSDLGHLLGEQGALDEAIEQLRIARSLEPEIGGYSLALGTTLLAMGNVAEAVPELEAAITRRPCWAVAHAHLAVALAQIGEEEAAAEHLRIATSLEPPTLEIRQLAARLQRRRLTGRDSVTVRTTNVVLHPGGVGQ